MATSTTIQAGIILVGHHLFGDSETPHGQAGLCLLPEVDESCRPSNLGTQDQVDDTLL